MNPGAQLSAACCLQNPAFIDFTWLPATSAEVRTCTQLHARRSLLAAADVSRKQLSTEPPPPVAPGSNSSVAVTSAAPGRAQLAVDTFALVNSGRRLQNLEKVMFATDADGNAPGPVLAVAARREARHRDGPGGGPKELIFNIGALPPHTTSKCATHWRSVLIVLSQWCSSRCAAQVRHAASQRCIPQVGSFTDRAAMCQGSGGQHAQRSWVRLKNRY